MLKVFFGLLYLIPLYAADDALAQERAARFATARAENIIAISDHGDILRHVQETVLAVGAENVLVAYDIDDCVTYPDHPACSPHNWAGVHKALFQSATDPLDPIKSSVFWNLQYVEPKSKLTDDDFPAVLEQLRGWNVRTIGLTASLAGILHDPLPNHRHRVGILDSLEVRFNAPTETIVIDEFPLFHGSHPTYYNGVAFAQSSMNYGSSTKGEIIMALTKRWEHKPKVVFMVDDSERNLHQVHKVLKDENGIDCRSFKYRSDRVHVESAISEADYEAFVIELLRKTEAATKEQKEEK